MPNRADKGPLAIVLYGPLRTASATAYSLLRHVVAGRDASIFYFGPSHTDAPTVSYKGKIDLFGSFKKNPKSNVSTTIPVDKNDLQKYGDLLKTSHFHDVRSDVFIAKAEAAITQSEWLMQLNPYRIFSMLHNIEGAIGLMLEHEKVAGRLFEEVIITRPDLAFFSSISADVCPGEVHIPEGEGLNVVGQPHEGNARVFFYKNLHTGDFVPGGGKVTFNDQLFWLKRKDIEPFLTISETLPHYLADRVPPSPETIFYLHLVGRGGLKPVPHPEWTYEIHRQGAPTVLNVADTPEINLIDRTHPAAVQMRKSRPIYSLLRDGRWLGRKAVRKFLG